MERDKINWDSSSIIHLESLGKETTLIPIEYLSCLQAKILHM